MVIRIEFLHPVLLHISPLHFLRKIFYSFDWHFVHLRDLWLLIKMDWKSFTEIFKKLSIQASWSRNTFSYKFFLIALFLFWITSFLSPGGNLTFSSLRDLFPVLERNGRYLALCEAGRDAFVCQGVLCQFASTSRYNGHAQGFWINVTGARLVASRSRFRDDSIATAEWSSTSSSRAPRWVFLAGGSWWSLAITCCTPALCCLISFERDEMPKKFATKRNNP